ncbi:MAG: hypothetical protein PHE03_06445 [Bacteroidales bacterium]|nr:hypothetical protein [Bacteroidales bacterium]
MINLIELEKRLDDALARETKESLTNWLNEQRQDNLVNFLGIGCFELLKSSPFSFNQEMPKKDEYICSNKNNPSDSLLKAA